MPLKTCTPDILKLVRLLSSTQTVTPHYLNKITTTFNSRRFHRRTEKLLLLFP